ncbi:hypothetical protein Psfp_03892 [Pelotomaculum sp. FP]|nr:HD domain-containing protein [Pelotomaculum sp. FP]TEB11763.1 hypothetical protein Psfp_03892 [Pelotomaculum sp. FP]
MSLVLAYFNNLIYENVNILAYASIYHDIGRTDNGVCTEHGRESFKKIKEYRLVKVNNENEEILKYIVENHCISDSLAFSSLKNYQIENNDRAILLLKILKDSDNLDRVRLGDLDISYLRCNYSNKLVYLANQLLRYIR